MQHAPTIVFITALAALLAGCAEKLPPDPGLLEQDLGIGLYLGTAADQARQLSPPGNIEFLVVSGEKFATTNPYEQRDEGTELVVAQAYPGAQKIYSDGSIVFDPIVTVKGFIRDEGPSQLTLFGTDMASLSPDSVIALLGEPESLTSSNDGSTHLSYRFNSRRLAERKLVATFSHYPDGRCFAFEFTLSLVD